MKFKFIIFFVNLILNYYIIDREDSTPVPMSVVEVRRRSRTGLHVPIDFDSDSSTSPAANSRKNIGGDR